MYEHFYASSLREATNSTYIFSIFLMDTINIENSFRFCWENGRKCMKNKKIYKSQVSSCPLTLSHFCNYFKWSTFTAGLTRSKFYNFNWIYNILICFSHSHPHTQYDMHENLSKIHVRENSIKLTVICSSSLLFCGWFLRGLELPKINLFVPSLLHLENDKCVLK